MLKFSVNNSKLNLNDLILIDEIELISPYQQSKNNELIIGKSKKTSDVFSKTVFKGENGKITTLKEKRHNNIFELYNNNENCGKLSRKTFKNINGNYFIVVYSKEEMNELTMCFVKPEDINLVADKDWIGVELTHMANIFSELSLIKTDFEFIPRLINKENISNILNFFNIKVENVLALKNIMDRAERERESRHGDNYHLYPMSKDDFISLFGEDSGLPFYLYQALECFLINLLLISQKIML